MSPLVRGFDQIVGKSATAGLFEWVNQGQQPGQDRQPTGRKTCL